MFQICSNLTMRNNKEVGKVILVSLLLTWDKLTRVLTVSTSGSDHQVNTIEKDIDPVTSLRFN